jgi:hypothetical protein
MKRRVPNATWAELSCKFWHANVRTWQLRWLDEPNPLKSWTDGALSSTTVVQLLRCLLLAACCLVLLLLLAVLKSLIEQVIVYIFTKTTTEPILASQNGSGIVLHRYY